MRTANVGEFELKKYRASFWPEWKKLLVTFLGMAALCLGVYLLNVPNPNMILITGLVACTAVFGLAPGAVSAAVMVVYSMFFFSTDHSFFHYTELNGQKLVIIIAGVVMNFAVVGRLKRVNEEAMEELRALNHMLLDDNRMLEQVSMTDALTGLQNRFALRRDFLELERHPVTVLMLDVDDFKSVNDRYGHETGDRVLESTGALLRELFGERHCYRYGGDEFLVVWPETDAQRISALTDELARRMRALRVGDEGVPVCFSGGYVYGVPELSSDLRQMLHHADNRLYEAKRRGKNQISGGRFRRTFSEQFAAPSGRQQ